MQADPCRATARSHCHYRRAEDRAASASEAPSGTGSGSSHGISRRRSEGTLEENVIQFADWNSAGSRHRFDQSDDVIQQAIVLTEFVMHTLKRTDNIRAIREYDHNLIQGNERLIDLPQVCATRKAESVPEKPSQHVFLQSQVSFSAVEKPSERYGYGRSKEARQQRNPNFLERQIDRPLPRIKVPREPRLTGTVQQFSRWRIQWA